MIHDSFMPDQHEHRMPPSHLSVIGTIEVAPSKQRHFQTCDDSSLERLLASLAQHRRLSRDLPERSNRLGFGAARRLSWLRHDQGALVIQANLSQLADDLQREYEALARLTT